MTEEHEPESPTAKAIYDALTGLGIRTITATYSGSDDSGCIDSVAALDGSRKPISLPAQTVTLHHQEDVWDADARNYVPKIMEPRPVALPEAVEDWCYQLLEEHHAGWENDDGSDGTITIDVRKRRCRITHTYYSRDAHTIKTLV